MGVIHEDRWRGQVGVKHQDRWRGQEAKVIQEDRWRVQARAEDEPEVCLPRPRPRPRLASTIDSERHCPVCGASVVSEKCKVVCRSDACLYRIIYTCSEF